MRRAVNGLGIKYPIAVDNHYTVSERFKTHTPVLCVVDARQRIRRSFVGKQGYDEAEQ